MADASRVEGIRNNPRFAGIEIVEGSGLFFEIPFIDKVEYHNCRLLTYDVDPREVTTRDKKRSSWTITPSGESSTRSLPGHNAHRSAASCAPGKTSFILSSTSTSAKLTPKC